MRPIVFTSEEADLIAELLRDYAYQQRQLSLVPELPSMEKFWAERKAQRAVDGGHDLRLDGVGPTLGRRPSRGGALAA